jgi:hypothetical protein
MYLICVGVLIWSFVFYCISISHPPGMCSFLSVTMPCVYDWLLHICSGVVHCTDKLLCISSYCNLWSMYWHNSSVGYPAVIFRFPCIYACNCGHVQLYFLKSIVTEFSRGIMLLMATPISSFPTAGDNAVAVMWTYGQEKMLVPFHLLLWNDWNESVCDFPSVSCRTASWQSYKIFILTVIINGPLDIAIQVCRLPVCSSGQSFWQQTQRSWVLFLVLPDFLSSSESGSVFFFSLRAALLTV